MFSHLSPARRRLAITTLVAAGVLAVAVAAIVVVRGNADDVAPVPQGDAGPVILVPGYGGSTAGLDVLAERLRDSGREAQVLPLVGDGRGDLRNEADALGAAVDALLAESGAESVDVIGYSAGGIVARLWVDEGGGDQARRVITLGSPHHGTDLAGLAGDLTPDSCPEACVQLAPESDLLRGLNAGDETPAGPLWVSIWTTDDQVVVPPSSAELDGAVSFSVQSVCAGTVVSHGDLPTNEVVAALVEFELAAETPKLPTAAVCAR